VKSAGAKNIVLAPGFLKIQANRLPSILTTKVQEGENVIPVSHAGKDGVPPGIIGDSSNATVSAIENFSITCTPKVPHDHGSKNITGRIESEGSGGVKTVVVKGSRRNPCHGFSPRGEAVLAEGLSGGGKLV